MAGLFIGVRKAWLNAGLFPFDRTQGMLLTAVCRL